ncbi:MAG: MnhB domain-containing protein [bacterium]
MNGMSLIVKTVTRVTVGVIFLFGCYLAAQGHATLGGGFAGGVVIALAFILYVLAYGRTIAEERLSKQLALILMELGAVFFLMLSFFGCKPNGNSESILCNLAIMVTLGAGLFVVFLTLVAFRVKVREEK